MKCIDVYRVQCIDGTLSLHVPVVGPCGGLYVLAVVNSASLKTGVHVLFQIVMFSRSEPRVGLLGPVAPLSSVLRTLHAVFHRGHTLGHPHSECRRIPFSLSSSAALLGTSF